MAASTDSTLPPPPETKKGGLGLKRIIIITAGSLIGVMVLIFVVAILLATNNIVQTAEMIRMLRDMMIIFLALEGILVVIALCILILQLAQLINLLQNEVAPILENTQDTIQTANSTVKFVTKNVTSPFISASSFAAGVSSVVGDLFGIRRAIRYSREEETERNGADGDE
jgi:hypothetical protein